VAVLLRGARSCQRCRRIARTQREGGRAHGPAGVAAGRRCAQGCVRLQLAARMRSGVQ
jgi:hypothetical protein